MANYQSKFKKGDKVLIARRSEEYTEWDTPFPDISDMEKTIGSEGTVKEVVVHDGYSVYRITNHRYNTTWLYDEDCIDPVCSEFVPELHSESYFDRPVFGKHKFNNGDIVRVIRRIENNAEWDDDMDKFESGEYSGIVIDENSTDTNEEDELEIRVYFELETGNENWNFDPICLELETDPKRIEQLSRLNPDTLP